MPSPVMLDACMHRRAGVAGTVEHVAHRARAAASRAASTRSILLITAVTSVIPVSRRIDRCSRVCGIGPSSAATTSSTVSIDNTPASMLARNRSCPGTSTKPDLAAGRQPDMREPEVDRHAALLFFRQTVRVDPGQRADQRGLAVIDMSGQSDDHGWFRLRESLGSRSDGVIWSGPMVADASGPGAGRA